MSVAIRCINPVIFGGGYPGYIYFIQMGIIGPVKVGYARDYAKRVQGLQISNPYKLNLLYATPGSLEDEQMMHQELRKYHEEIHIKGEWYHPGKVIFETIKNFKKWDIRDKN
jgi:hypothetical protein